MAIATGALFISFGTAGLAVVGREAWLFYGLPVALGTLAVLIGWSVIAMRTRIDDEGISVTSWFGVTREVVAWSKLTAWAVTSLDGSSKNEAAIRKAFYGDRALPWPPPSFIEDAMTFRALLFKVDGKKWPIVIYDSEAYQPPFETFVDEVRARVGAKEVASEPARP